MSFTALILTTLLVTAPQDETMADDAPELDIDQVRAAGRVVGHEFTQAELELMLGDVTEHLASYRKLWERPLENAVAPALSFTPLLPGIEADPWRPPPFERILPDATRPDDLEELAFADIATLAALIQSRQVSCVELTRMFLARLHRLDEQLHFVITTTDERALTQAANLDAELEQGRWRGPLHGIPWGAKDLLAAKGERTTWGAKPFEEQVIDMDATVVQRLDEAGAVLVAKLTLGALAWGDVWYGETTRNPWNPEQGSSGSSAGPASATAAGAIPFAIGSETLGSIVSPSNRCGSTSLRPTFGRISRHGAMALSWSMDKLGPIGRSVEDLALVMAALTGPDGHDATVVDLPYTPPGPTDVEGWRVGYVPDAFKQSPAHRPVLSELEALGVELVPVELPDAEPVADMLFVLHAEAGAAFDALTRDGRDEQLVRQVREAWPNVFRASRLIPAVEYINANRLRTRLCLDMDAMLREADVVALVHPPYAGGILGLTNLTGHPALTAPCGFRDDDTPFTVSFTGLLYDEARLLALGAAWQAVGGHHRRHPDEPPR